MITVCPECDTAELTRRVHKPVGVNTDGNDYRCANGHTFDTPAERERVSSHSTHGLAKQLEEMDP